MPDLGCYVEIIARFTGNQTIVRYDLSHQPNGKLT